jgi:hypothetical protein
VAHAAHSTDHRRRTVVCRRHRRRQQETFTALHTHLDHLERTGECRADSAAGSVCARARTEHPRAHLRAGQKVNECFTVHVNTSSFVDVYSLIRFLFSTRTIILHSHV